MTLTILSVLAAALLQTYTNPILWSGKGIIDTCPLRDDDGRIYMVHA